MNESNEYIKSLLAQTYRPPPQTPQEREVFHRQVRRRVRRSAMVRVATISVLLGVLALFVWRPSFEPRPVRLPSIEQTEISPSLIVESSPNQTWSDALVDAWSEIDDLAPDELFDLQDIRDHYIGIELPESMMVIAGIVNLTN